MNIASLTLNDVCELIVDCEHKTAPTQEIGYPSIRTPNIGKGRLLLDGVNRVSEETYRLWTQRAIPKAGDLILAREAPVGNVAIVPENLDVCLGQRTVLIRPNTVKVNNSYLVYLLLSDEIRGRLLSRSNGSTVGHLNMREIRNLELPELPLLSTQQRIADVLSNYDRLIDNNTRRIALLESSIHRLYQEWFVHLRFPGWEKVAIVDGVPEGWNKQTLNDISLEVRQGIHPSQTKPNTPYVGLEHIPRQSIALTDWGFSRDVDSNKFKFAHKDILFGKIRPYFHKVVIAPVTGICSSDTIVMRPMTEEFLGLLLSLTSSVHFVDFSSKTSKEGSKMPRADWKIMKQYPVLVPPQPILTNFNSFVTNVVGQIENLIFTNQKLHEARDLLLPRLMNGSIAL